MDTPITRRTFLGGTSRGIGLAALTSLLPSDALGAEAGRDSLSGLHFPASAKRVIFLHQSGAPSQVDLFDHKPELEKQQGRALPESFFDGQRLTSMTSDQKSKRIAASIFKFARHGQSGAEISTLLPHTAQVADDLCIVKSMYTEAINHDPGITFMQTGSEQPGRPSMGAWLNYGLGNESSDLPAYAVFISGGQPGDQPLMGRLWGAGFLPSHYQGVKFRSSGEPVLYLKNPPGIDRRIRRRMLDGMAALNRMQHEQYGDPEIASRIEQFEMAFRLQKTLPELTDLSGESKHTMAMYGADAARPGSYARNCLLARRLIERGTRFVQLYHRGWDHHKTLPRRIRDKCRETDQGSAALVADLKQRGLLDDTLVVWAGEFGRTVYCQGDLTAGDYGRDHHPRCFTIWMAGGGVKSGIRYGRTDDFSYNVAADGVHVHDLQATILHCLGIDHRRLTYRFQGRDFRLTDVAGKVVHSLLKRLPQ